MLQFETWGMDCGLEETAMHPARCLSAFVLTAALGDHFLGGGSDAETAGSASASVRPGAQGLSNWDEREDQSLLGITSKSAMSKTGSTKLK
jgi:hypothetical protein